MEDVATVKKMTVKMTALLLSSSSPFFWFDTLRVLTKLTKTVRWISYHPTTLPRLLGPSNPGDHPRCTKKTTG